GDSTALLCRNPQPIMLPHNNNAPAGCQPLSFAGFDRLPGAQAAAALALRHSGLRNALAGEARHDLVLAVPVEVGQHHVVAAAAVVSRRDRGAVLAHEPTLAVAEEHPGAAVAGHAHQVLLAVAVEVAGREGEDAIAPFFIGQRPALPDAVGARIEDVDAGAPDTGLDRGVADREVQPAVAVEVGGGQSGDGRARAHPFKVGALPGAVRLAEAEDRPGALDVAAHVEVSDAVAVPVAGGDRVAEQIALLPQRLPGAVPLVQVDAETARSLVEGVVGGAGTAEREARTLAGRQDVELAVVVPVVEHDHPRGEGRLGLAGARLLELDPLAPQLEVPLAVAQHGGDAAQVARHHQVGLAVAVQVADRHVPIVEGDGRKGGLPLLPVALAVTQEDDRLDAALARHAMHDVG